MCSMMSTVYVSSRIVAIISGSSLIVSQMLLSSYGPYFLQVDLLLQYVAAFQ